ncbi:MAG TPA: hypothetical protein VGI19_04380 [Candidatus Cybelea sp.]
MRTLAQLLLPLVLVLLAGCENGGPGTGPSAGSLPVRYEPLPDASAGSSKSGGLLYVADYLNAIVLIYRESGRNRAPIGQITQGLYYPASIAFDPAGNLYVVNDPGNVQIYPPGATKPTRMLSPRVYSDSVAAGGDGTIYVGTDCSGCTEKVDAFRGGASAPWYAISDPQVAIVRGMAVDAANNLYVAHTTPQETSRISVFPQGSTGPGKDLGLSFKAAVGLAFDAKGNMLVADVLANEVYVFSPGSTTPIQKISTPPGPWNLAFNAAQTRLYVNQNRQTPQVDVFSYPQGKLTETIPLIPGADADGVAISPVLAK